MDTDTKEIETWEKRERLGAEFISTPRKLAC